jgi:hypothetical protein
MTNEIPPSDQNDFQEELEALRLLLQSNMQKINQDPFLGTITEFWMESAKFMELNIELWERTERIDKRQEAVKRMRKVLDALQQIIDRLNDQSGEQDL